MAAYEIVVHLEAGAEEAGIDTRLLQSAAEAALMHENLPPPVALTLVVTDDETIQQLNRDFLGMDKATDVLSFPAGDPMPGLPADEPVYLGDIMLSYPYASRQAAAAGHSVAAELNLLVVHGVLHLLGHDHAGEDEKAQMWAAQTAVLAELGIAHVRPTEA